VAHAAQRILETKGDRLGAGVHAALENVIDVARPSTPRLDPSVGTWGLVVVMLKSVRHFRGWSGVDRKQIDGMIAQAEMMGRRMHTREAEIRRGW
jgi:hypothetical protein